MTAPANDDFADAIVLSGSLPITRTGDTNVDATLESGEPTGITYGYLDPSFEDFEIDKTVWYAWTCGTAGTYSAQIDTDFDSVLTLYTGGSVGGLTRLEQSEFVWETPLYEVVYFEGLAGTTYYFQAGGYGGASGSIDFELATATRPANDAFANAILLTGSSPITASGSNVGASLQAGELTPVDGTYREQTKTVWYRWTATASGVVDVTVTPGGRWGSEGFAWVAIFTGTSPTALTLIAEGETTATFEAVSGTTYRIQVGAHDGYGFLEGDFDLELVLGPPYFPASITPITLTGGSATVSATNTSATTEFAEQLTYGAFGFSGTVSKTVWWSWEADSAGVATFDTFTSTFDTTAAVFSGGTAMGLTCVDFNNDYAGGTATVETSQIGWTADAGETYYVQVASAGTASGTINAHLYFEAFTGGETPDPPPDFTDGDQYRVELRSLNSSGFNVTTASLELVSFSCNWRLNAPGAFEGTGVIGVTQADAANVGARELIVYKGDYAIWGGYLTFFDADEDSKQIRITAEGYWSRARSRLIRGNQIYKPLTNYGVAWKADVIAWDVIDQAQGATNGDMGWVYGGHDGTRKNCKRTYLGVDRHNIGDAIETLAREGYFDFAVDVRQTPAEGNVAMFRTWYERGSDLTGSVNLSSSNAMTLNYSLSSSDMATVIDVFGSVAGCRGVAATDEANLSTYGRLEARPIDMETDEQGEVDETASRFIDQHSVPAKNATVTYLEGVGPSLNDYDLGDTIRVAPGDGYVAYFDGRVISRELGVEAGRAVITVEVER